MKYLIIILSAIVVSQAHAWEFVTPDLKAVYGTRIEQTFEGNPPFAEIVHNIKSDEYGISFLDSKGKRQRMEYGIANIRSCGVDTSAAIVESNIQVDTDPSEDNRIFRSCKRPSYIRIWNTENKHVTYKFEKVDNE